MARHNEHRILTSRLLTLAIYKITGHVNILTILWAQQLFWLAFVGLIGWLGHRVRLWQSPWLGLPVVLLLFHPNTFDTLLNAWGGSQTYPVLLFMVGSLLALRQCTTSPRKTLWFSIALLAAALATFSFGSGFMVWVGGVVYLYFEKNRHPLRLMISWLVAGGVIVSFYIFWQYTPTQTSSISIRPFNLVKFALLFPGAPFMSIWPSYWPAFANVILCFILGAGSWLFTGWLLKTGYGFQNPLLFSLLATALSTGILLALGRSGTFGTIAAFTSRYQVFANLIPLFICLILVDRYQSAVKKLFVATSVLLLLVQGLIVWQLVPMLDQQYAKKEKGLNQWARYRTPTLSINATLQDMATNQLERCLQRGIYVLPNNLAQ